MIMRTYNRQITTIQHNDTSKVGINNIHTTTKRVTQKPLSSSNGEAWGAFMPVNQNDQVIFLTDATQHLGYVSNDGILYEINVSLLYFSFHFFFFFCNFILFLFLFIKNFF
jgi:hypothetical protein